VPWRRGVADNSAVIVQQIDLDRGIDRHQLVEQAAHRVGPPAVGVHQLGGAGDMGGQPGRQLLGHGLFVAGAGLELQPYGDAAAGQQQHGEDQGQPLGQHEALHALSPAANL